MKKLVSFILVFVMLVPTVAFADYNVSDWAEAEVAKAEENALIPAEFENFDLTQNITRAEFAAISYKLFEKLKGEELEFHGGYFADIEGNPYEFYIRGAYAFGITNGTAVNEDGSVVFSPDEYITREQLATMLCRTLMKIVFDNTELPEEYVADVPFEDDAQISDYAKVAVYCMSEIGVIKGVSETKFAPLDTATREQAILLSARIYEDSIEDAAEKTVVKIENPESYISKTFDELVAEFGEPVCASNGGEWPYMFYFFENAAFGFDGVRMFAPVDGTPVYPEDELYEEPTGEAKVVLTYINAWLGEDRISYTLEEICEISGLNFDDYPTELWSGDYFRVACDNENEFWYLLDDVDGVIYGEDSIFIVPYSYEIYDVSIYDADMIEEEE